MMKITLGRRGAAIAGRARAITMATATPAITTEILPAPTFYYAEAHHQQYLARNPGGYCGLGGTGVACPAGIAVEA